MDCGLHDVRYNENDGDLPTQSESEINVLTEDMTPQGTILIVDDAPLSIKMLSRILDGAGYQVQTALDGKSALASVAASPPDLILLDVMMPEMDGFAVAEELKNGIETCDVPIIFLSALSAVSDKLRGFQAGGIDYITKPFHPQEVVARVTTHLRLRHLTQQLQDRLSEREATVAELSALTQRQQDTLRRTEGLNRAGQALLMAAPLTEMLSDLAQHVASALPADRVSIALFDKTGQAVETFIEAGPGAIYDQVPTLSDLMEGLAGWAVSRMQPALSAKDTPDPRESYSARQRRRALGCGSFAVTPIYYDKQILGVIQACNRPDERNFEHADIALLSALSAQVAISVTHQRAVKQLEQAEARLRCYAAELEAQNAELDAFAHTVAHDLKNPLGALAGMAALIEDHCSRTGDPDAAHMALTIRSTTNHLHSIVDELLLLATVRQLDEIPRSYVDMEIVVEDALVRVADMLQASGATIQLSDSWPLLRSYAPWLTEVWVNYISNAIKYGGSPPALELGWDKGRQIINDASGATTVPTLQFWLQDNGAGLTPEEQERLFVQFERLDERQIEGHGLGLSIVRRIVEKLGGRVGVDSAPGKGSRFYFILPTSDID